MAGIAGIARDNAQGEVNQMLNHMPHRGRAGREIRCVDGITLGACWPEKQALDCVFPRAVVDRFGAVHVAEARVRNRILVLTNQGGVAVLPPFPRVLRTDHRSRARRTHKNDDAPGCRPAVTPKRKPLVAVQEGHEQAHLFGRVNRLGIIDRI